MSEKSYFDRYIDRKGEWRWRLETANNRIIADSGEGYSSLDAVDRAIATVKREAPLAGLK